MMTMGEIVNSYGDDIIHNFAIASDNYVRTRYKVADEYHKRIDEDISIPIVLNSGETMYETIKAGPGEKFAHMFWDDTWGYDYSKYEKLFIEISDRATRNLKVLDNPRVISALATSEWLYSNIGAINGLDNTFICAGYFKLIEILLSIVIRKHYVEEATNTLFDSKERPLNLNDEEQNNKILMLKRMIVFLVNTLEKESPYNEWKGTIQTALESGLVSTRNGYFHKDILTLDKVLNIRCKTMEIIYIVLGVFVKDI